MIPSFGIEGRDQVFLLHVEDCMDGFLISSTVRVGSSGLVTCMTAVSLAYLVPGKGVKSFLCTPRITTSLKVHDGFLEHHPAAMQGHVFVCLFFS
jgi:hypothetical protein